MVWLLPTTLVVSTQLPVPPESVIVQLPPAPLTATLPVGVPLLPETVAVMVEGPLTVTLVGFALRLTVAAPLLPMWVYLALAAPFKLLSPASLAVSVFRPALVKGMVHL